MKSETHKKLTKEIIEKYLDTWENRYLAIITPKTFYKKNSPCGGVEGDPVIRNHRYRAEDNQLKYQWCEKNLKKRFYYLEPEFFMREYSKKDLVVIEWYINNVYNGVESHVGSGKRMVDGQWVEMDKNKDIWVFEDINDAILFKFSWA